MVDLCEKKSERKRLTRGEEDEILKRQDYKCAMCGRELTRDVFVKFDHRLALSLGGNDEIGNIQALCPNCEAKKTRQDRSKLSKKKRRAKSKLLKKYDLPILGILIHQWKNARNPETRSKLRNEVRGKIPYLPSHKEMSWDDNLRDIAFGIIDILRNELENHDVGRDWWKEALQMLRLIAFKKDEITLNKMRNDFLDILMESYLSVRFEKREDLIHLLQILNDHDPEFAMRLTEDAINTWSDSEFHLYTIIDKTFLKDKERMDKMLSYVVSEQEKETEKQERLATHRILLGRTTIKIKSEKQKRLDEIFNWLVRDC